MSINEIQDELIEEFELFDNWMDKYEHIIAMGRELEPLAEKYKVDENLVKGCQSRVWLHTCLNNNRVAFEADSDAVITKGLVGMVVRVLSNHSPDEILHSDLYFVERIGLREHLSPNRSNGLASMIKQIKIYALGYASKQEG